MSRRTFLIKNLYAYILLFIFASTFGYLMEVIGTSIAVTCIVDRGFLHFPLLPIYGIGSILLVQVFSKRKYPYIMLFLLIVILLSFLEYYSGYLLKKVFNQTWWSYDSYKYNVDGYISLWSSIGFGLGGMIVLFLLWPMCTYIADKLKNKTLFYIAVPYSFLILCDFVISSYLLLH